MVSDWVCRPLRDCATWFSGGTPSKSNPEYWNGSIPWISAKSLTEFFVYDSEDKVTEAGAENGTRLVPKDAILFIVRGMSLKSEFRMGITTRSVTFNQDLKALIALDGVLPAFLAYAIKGRTHEVLGMVGEAGHGTGVLPTDRIQALEILLPPGDEQRAIAHILGTLDDKIELNRRTNETLEAMARALFKAWFVDFEPVRAKLEGRWQRGQSLPGLPAHFYELFPDRFDYEGVPEGWSWVSASKLIEFNPTEALRKGTQAPYLDMASLPTSGSWPEPPLLREFGSGMRFRNGDALLARITPCLENGKTAFVQCLPDGTVGWGSTEYIVMRSKAPVPAEYAYLLARDDRFREHAIRSMTGTSGRQRAQSDSVAAFKLAAPPDEKLWDVFARQVVPTFESIKSNAKASETLVQLRDTLLPKLISGELRISDAERFLKERGL